MKLIDMTCPRCGAQLKIDAEDKQAACEYCGAKLLIDDEVRRLAFDGAEKAGYEFEMGRQRAQAEAQQAAPISFSSSSQQQRPKKKHGAGWWVGMALLWICFLPIMAIVYVARNPNLNRKTKIGIIAAICVATLFFYVFNPRGGESANTGASVDTDASVDTPAQASALASKDNPYGTIDAFVEQYNATHDVKITDTVQFDPYLEHQTSGPYSRVEYRLGAYKTSVGLHGRIGDDTIDLVSFGNLGNYDDFRVYIDQNDKDYERTIGYAHEVVDTFFIVADYSVPSNEMSDYEEDWNRFDEQARKYDYAYASNTSLRYSDYPVQVNAALLSAQKGEVASLLADFSM